MPNHITNIIEIRGDRLRVKEMLEQIRREELGIGSIDFQKIIPMPPSLNIEAGSTTDKGLKAYREFIARIFPNSKEKEVDLTQISKEQENAFLQTRPDVDAQAWEYGKAAFQNIQQYGAPTWYEWSIANWGTKWNAYGRDTEDVYEDDNTLRFLTAWSAPHPVISALAERYPDIEFIHEWADEDIGQNCGRIEYAEGYACEEHYPEANKERIEFAARVMGVSPEEYGLYLNARGTDYIGIRDEEYQLIELFGQPALFTDSRITNADIPKGLYCYHLRETDDGNCFGLIEAYVVVNHGGSVITKSPIDLNGEGYVAFTDDTLPNFVGKTMTLGEYMHTSFEQEQETMLEEMTL